MNKNVAFALAFTLLILVACAVALLISHHHNMANRNPEIEIQPNNSYSRTLHVVADYNYEPYTFMTAIPSQADTMWNLSICLQTRWATTWICADAVGRGSCFGKNSNADLVLTAAYSSEESSIFCFLFRWLMINLWPSVPPPTPGSAICTGNAWLFWRKPVAFRVL